MSLCMEFYPSSDWIVAYQKKRCEEDSKHDLPAFLIEDSDYRNSMA